MADTWSYDGAVTLSDTFTPESLTYQYSLFVDFGGFSGLEGPYPGGGPQVLNVTADAPPSGGFFNARRGESPTDLIKAVGLFLEGTAGAQTVSYDPLTYDGASTVSTTVHSSSALYDYTITCGDPASSFTVLQGNGGDLALSVTDVGGLSPGDLFEGRVRISVHGGSSFGSADVDVWWRFGTPGVGDPSPDVPAGGAGGVKVSIAFDDPALEPNPTWTDITERFVAGYEIDRGRQYEFDRTDTGTARVRINDRDGLLDPTNTTGPYYGLIEPLLQIQIELWNPVTSEYSLRFRGHIEDYDYVVEPSAHLDEHGDTVGVTRLRISCVGLFAITTAIEMQPGQFGDTPPLESAGNIFFDNAGAQDRIAQVLGNASIPTEFYVVFSLNVNMQESVYSPSENVLQVVQDAADAEFPTVSNVYEDRFGRIVVHGRLAKFDPEGTASGAGPDAWDFHHWKCGDGAAVALSITDTAQFREFSFNRGLAQVRNSSLCTPNGIGADPATAQAEMAGQLFKDDTSIGLRGIRSWSAENLFIGAPTGDPLTGADAGILTGNSALEECLLFATFITTNYAEPRNRITNLTFRSMRPEDPRAAANWELLCKADISDLIDVTVTNPGGGGFNLEPFFIEGVRESAEPLNGEYANVTLNLDVSPQALFANPVGLDGV